MAFASCGKERRVVGAINQEPSMLYWTVALLVIALIAAFLGFGGIAASAAGIAKILFFVFIVLAILSFVFGRRAPT
jgi:uncharacterized membrane protein YtjA (UPF0391 family)